MTTPMTAPLQHRFIEPLDVLFLRGNKLFGAAGSYGESLVPPWPSVAAGALRSAMLAREGIDLAAFARGELPHPSLGTPKAPGPFTVTGFTLARRLEDGQVESLHPLPADLVAEDHTGTLTLRRMAPVQPADGLLSSAPLGLWPVLPQPERSKAASGCWLTQAGWAAYLGGGTPTAAQVLKTKDLWALDERVGVGLNPELRRAADGQLFTVQAVAFRAGIGFLASVAGAQPPSGGTLRLGGDGRAAAVHAARHQPAQTDLAALARAGRARLVLTTPGLFPQGWPLPGLGEDLVLEAPGFSARLVCAAVPRADVISGWNLAERAPKPAERIAPTGSVYWLADLQATPQALGNFAESGLWPAASHNGPRRAEGFNRFTWAAW